jgi:hypothetical protein
MSKKLNRAHRNSNFKESVKLGVKNEELIKPKNFFFSYILKIKKDLR